MGEREVTQAEYQALMGMNPSFFAAPNFPVEQVSWNDARAYCQALTAREVTLARLPVGYEYRLPTEAEWEYACRAGTVTEYNVGADIYCGDAAFFYSTHSYIPCGLSSPVPGGSYAPNGFGLYDMHGNVREWCLDSFFSYAPGAVSNPLATGGVNRVVRGGSWGSNSSFSRSAYRYGNNPGDSYNYIGFRLVLGEILAP